MAANISLKVRKHCHKHSEKKINKPRYRNDLHDMKISLDNNSKSLAFNPYDMNLRQKCFALSKRYNRTRKERRRNYFKSILEKLKDGEIILSLF